MYLYTTTATANYFENNNNRNRMASTTASPSVNNCYRDSRIGSGRGRDCRESCRLSEPPLKTTSTREPLAQDVGVGEAWSRSQPIDEEINKGMGNSSAYMLQPRRSGEYEFISGLTHRRGLGKGIESSSIISRVPLCTILLLLYLL